MRDGDIRRPLHDWLVDSHRHDPETGILHELKMPRPSARIDLAVVNGEIAGFEIKSDADSLARLPRQIAAFSRVFDRVCLVTTAKHVRAVQRAVPAWWGIMTLGLAGDDPFIRVQPSEPNPSPDHEAILYALTRRELLAALAGNGVKGGQALRKVALVRFAADHLSHDALRFSAKVALLHRAFATSGYSPPSSPPILSAA